MKKKIKSLFVGSLIFPLLFLSGCGSQSNIVANWEYYCYQLPELDEKTGNIIPNSRKNYKVTNDFMSNQVNVFKYNDNKDSEGKDITSSLEETRLIKLYSNIASKIVTYCKNMSVFATKKIQDDLFFTTTVKNDNLTNENITVRSGFYFSNSDMMSSGNSDDNIGFGITTTYFNVQPCSFNGAAIDNLSNWYDDYTIPSDWNLVKKDLYVNDTNNSESKKNNKTMIKFFKITDIKVLFKFYKKNSNDRKISSYFNPTTDFINSTNSDDYNRLVKRYANTYVNNGNKYSPKPLNEDNFNADGYCVNFTDMYSSLVYSPMYEKSDTQTEITDDTKITNFRPASFSYIFPSIIFDNYLRNTNQDNIFVTSDDTKKIQIDKFRNLVTPNKQYLDKSNFIENLFDSNQSKELFDFIIEKYNKPIINNWVSKLNTQHSGDISVNDFIENSEEIYKDFYVDNQQNNSKKMTYKDMYKLYMYTPDTTNDHLKLIEVISESNSDNWKKLYTNNGTPGYKIYNK